MDTDKDMSAPLHVAANRARNFLHLCLSVFICGSFLFSCSRAADTIRISSDGKGFTLDGKPWVAWGFNYDRDYKSRLIEDYWDGEWPTVEKHFKQMHSLGANAVRIHISFGKFMSGIDKPDDHSLDQLDRLVGVAEQEGIYLDITGLGMYRKSDIPPWYDALDEAGHWDAQANFWKAIAARLKGRRGVWAYDLVNEPMMPFADAPRKAGTWLEQWSRLGEFYYCQYPVLDLHGRSRPEAARQWAHHLVTAIHGVDDTHLITLGFLPNSVGDGKGTSGFAPAIVGKELDYISVHIYPAKGKVQDSVDLAKKFDVGKPLVIEEMYPINCSLEEVGQFVDGTRPFVSGWLGFYWGQGPEELRLSKQLIDVVQAGWLDLFQKMKSK